MRRPLGSHSAVTPVPVPNTAINRAGPLIVVRRRGRLSPESFKESRPGIVEASPGRLSRALVSSGGCKAAACLFAFLVGLLGARKFYLGQPLSGVFCLLVTLLLFWTSLFRLPSG